MLQFLLAGALVVAWIWMLGRPLLTMLARRSRRDSVGHFRYQQAALGQTVGTESAELLSRYSPLRPLLEWRDQPIERRRLQLLLGSAFATFASVLLAIALRGVYLRLLLLMSIAFAGHLLVAAAVGSRELRANDARQRRRAIEEATQRSVGRSVAVGVSDVGEERRDDDVAELDDLLTGDGLGGGLFDEGFFEPIPELEPQVGARLDRDEDEHGEPTAPAASDGERQEPTFTSAPVARPRPGRPPKGRPIYVESEPEEGDGTVRAAND